jgi:hypothetical protein
MLKFVLDVGVGRKVEAFLTSSGYDIISIIDVARDKTTTLPAHF